MWLLPISPPADHFLDLQQQFLRDLSTGTNSEAETAKQRLLTHLKSKTTRREYIQHAAGSYYTPLPSKDKFQLWKLSLPELADIPDEKPLRKNKTTSSKPSKPAPVSGEAGPGEEYASASPIHGVLGEQDLRDQALGVGLSSEEEIESEEEGGGGGGGGLMEGEPEEVGVNIREGGGSEQTTALLQQQQPLQQPIADSQA